MMQMYVKPKTERNHMRAVQFSALAAMLLMNSSTPAQESPQAPAGGRQGGGAQSEEAAARYAAADVRILTVGIIYNAGLVDLTAAFTKETGKKVAVNTIIMGGAVNAIKTANPPADVIMLPFELMSSLSLDGNVVPGTYLPLGRSEMGLAVRAGAPHPDISTVEKLAAALRNAKMVMRSDPSHGSMVAKVIEDKVIKRPEFAGVNSQVNTKGEGGQALAHGEGDMAIQAICEIYP